MTEKLALRAPSDPNKYRENRSNFPLEELVPYGDQWVAWNSDATKILAHHEDMLQVTEMLKAMGMASAEVVLEWIPPGGEVDSLL